MFILSIRKVIILSVFAFFPAGFYFPVNTSAEERNSMDLRSQLITAFEEILEAPEVEGILEFSEEKWNGHIVIPVAKDTTGFSGIILSFFDDSLNADINLLCMRDSIRAELRARLTDDELTGKMLLYGKCVKGEIKFFSSKDFEGDYDLNASMLLKELKLKGHLENVRNRKNELLHEIKQISDKLKFEDLYLDVRGDSSITYDGLNLRCTASLNAAFRNPGLKHGRVWVNSGELWKYGNSFKIISGEYDFSSGKFYIKGALNKSALTASGDSGYRRTDYQLTFEHTGLSADSNKCLVTSIPPLSDERIVNLLVRGSPDLSDQPDLIDTNVEGMVKNALENYRSDKYTKYAERQVGRLVTFDRVVIEGNVFASGSVFRASKDLTGELSLHVRGTVGGIAEQTVSFEYPLTSRIFLINETNQYGRTGLDLRYVLRYK